MCMFTSSDAQLSSNQRLLVLINGKNKRVVVVPNSIVYSADSVQHMPICANR